MSPRALERLPAWAGTGVGSLPFDSAIEAADHAVAAYDLPFCPQVPSLEGDMVAEWLGSDPKRCGWSAQRDRQRPVAWESFLEALDRSPPAHRLVKLQVTGPVTLACALQRSGEGAPKRGETVDLGSELARWLAANVAEQVMILADRGLDSVLIVDEPALGSFAAEGIERVWDPLRTAAAAWGLHLCCPFDWSLIDRAEPDVLSFDLTLRRLDQGAVATLDRLLGRGGRVAWGVVVAYREDEGEKVALQRLREVGELFPDRRSQSLVTATCGTGRVAPERERSVAARLRRTADVLRCGPRPG